MSARRVSRAPYRVGRDRREVWVAVAVAAAIVLVTAAIVWVLAPADEPEAPSFNPTLTLPPAGDAPGATTPGGTTPATGTPGGTEAPAPSATTPGG